MKQAYRLSNTSVTLAHTVGIVFLLLALVLANYIRPKKEAEVCTPASVQFSPVQFVDEQAQKEEALKMIQELIRDTDQVVHDGIIIYQKK